MLKAPGICGMKSSKLQMAIELAGQRKRDKSKMAVESAATRVKTDVVTRADASKWPGVYDAGRAARPAARETEQHKGGPRGGLGACAPRTQEK